MRGLARPAQAHELARLQAAELAACGAHHQLFAAHAAAQHQVGAQVFEDRKSTRLNSSHLVISYAVFCLKKKKTQHRYQSVALELSYRPGTHVSVADARIAPPALRRAPADALAVRAAFLHDVSPLRCIDV